jgi:hypothetical protein
VRPKRLCQGINSNYTIGNRTRDVPVYVQLKQDVKIREEWKLKVLDIKALRIMFLHKHIKISALISIH